MKKFVIFGASAFLSDIFDIIHANGGKVHQIYLNMAEVIRDRVRGVAERVAMLGYDVPIFDSLNGFKPKRDTAYVIGTSAPQKYLLVEELKENYGLSFLPLLHPTAFFGSNAHVGEGVIVNARATFAPNVYLDDFCVVNRCVTVGHDSRVGKHTLLGPNVSVAGSTLIGEKCTVGISATIMDRMQMGNWVIVGAGALVNKDLPSGVVAFGVPAKIIRENAEQDYEKYKANRAIK